jgi:hypothetical protein
VKSGHPLLLLLSGRSLTQRAGFLSIASIDTAVKVLHSIWFPLAAASLFAAEDTPAAPASSAQTGSAPIEAADALLERAGVPCEVRAGLQAALKTLQGTLTCWSPRKRRLGGGR